MPASPDLTTHLQKILIAQFEAALAMLKDCIQACPAEHWEGIIGKYPFWQVAYHTLCFVDLYLSPDEKTFQLRDLHPAGWAEFNEEHPSRLFTPAELLRYIDICRDKAREIFAAETAEFLQTPSGISWIPFSRAELHLYNLRHLQHHTGQLGAYLRKAIPTLQSQKSLPWIRTGWR